MEEVRRVEKQERLVGVYKIENVVLQKEMEMVERVWVSMGKEKIKVKV